MAEVPTDEVMAEVPTDEEVAEASWFWPSLGQKPFMIGTFFLRTDGLSSAGHDPGSSRG